MLGKFDKLYTSTLQEATKKNCWKGYERTPGTERGEPGSCRKKTYEASDDIPSSSFGTHDPHFAQVHYMVRDLFKQKQAAYPDADAASLFDSSIEDLESQYRDDERVLHILHDISMGFADKINEKNSKCTGPTKKASSTSKGKKYMKCVKDGSGYKRIHWGQKGAKASSGNSKRKKAFRARHKCSSAKANTPRGQACKDW